MQRQPHFNHASSGLLVRFRREEFDWLVLKLGWSCDRAYLPDPEDADSSDQHWRVAHAKPRIDQTDTTCLFRRLADWSHTQGVAVFSRSEKLLIFTAPSGNRAMTSSSPPIASMWLRSVERYMSVRFSSLAIDGCCT